MHEGTSVERGGINTMAKSTRRDQKADEGPLSKFIVNKANVLAHQVPGSQKARKKKPSEPKGERPQA